MSGPIPFPWWFAAGATEALHAAAPTPTRRAPRDRWSWPSCAVCGQPAVGWVRERGERGRWLCRLHFPR